MSRIAIIVLKPNKGCYDRLKTFLKKSISTLQQLGIATHREQIVVESEDGTLIQIFEWASESSQGSAAEHAEVRDLWMEAERLSEFLKPCEVKEFNEKFPSFKIVI